MAKKKGFTPASNLYSKQVAPYLDSLKPEIPLDEQMAVTDRTQELLAMQELERQRDAREMLKQSVLNPDTAVREPIFGGLDGFPGQYGLHYNEPSMIPSDWTGDAGRGEIVEGAGDRAAYGANAGRGNVVEGAGDRAAFPPGVWDAPAYEREVYLGEIPAESTSNLTAIELADTVDAISAKYKGSTTDASSEAELGEIINAMQLQFSEPMDLDEYNELSTRDLIKPSLTYLEDKAGSHSASSDLYAQNERQPHGRGDGLGQALQNQAIIDSIFTQPDVPVIRNEPSLFVPNNFQAQIRPSVAQTQNNMTVPTTRDEKLTARYGNPFGW
jgi:hypothetical protein